MGAVTHTGEGEDLKKYRRTAKPWGIRVKGHPYVTDGDRQFGDLSELERFVGKNDIQLDHIIKVERYERLDNVITTYEVSDILSISAVRLVLVKECPEVLKVLFDNHGQLLGTG